MRRIAKYLAWALVILALVLGIAALVWRDRIARLMVVNSLFSAEDIVHNFGHMDEAFLTTEVPRGDGAVVPLATGPQAQMPAGYDDWAKTRALTGIVVLRGGRLVHEAYFLGTGPEDRRISWSVAKSFLSALMGTLVAEGRIALDRPVTDYAPQLAGSAYDGATVLNVLQMSSGVTFNEDYLDFNSDINRMGRVLALGGSMDGFAAGLMQRDAEPGTRWQYVSIDTHVVGMVIRGAAGRPIAELLSERIVAPLGLEVSPYYVTDGHGVAFVLGGLNLRTRDYARFGQMILQGGSWQGRQLVPEDWLRLSTAPSARTAPGQEQYGYQWWIAAGAPAGEFFARGIYGQYIFVDRTSGVVIAVNSADRLFEEPGAHESMIAMFRAIARGG